MGLNLKSLLFGGLAGSSGSTANSLLFGGLAGGMTPPPPPPSPTMASTKDQQIAAAGQAHRDAIEDETLGNASNAAAAAQSNPNMSDMGTGAARGIYS